MSFSQINTFPEHSQTFKVNLYTSDYEKLDKSLYRCEVTINVVKEEIVLDEKLENNVSMI